jgi:type III secretory pathway lipoprotein EscJ
MFKGDGMNISHKIVVGDITRRPLPAASLFPADNTLPSPRKLSRSLSFILLILPLFITACGDATSLATVSTESDAIEILNVLHENGINAHKEDVGEEGVKQWRIVLDQSWFGGAEEVALANQVLQDNGLPRPTYSGAAPVSDSGMFKDEATRKAEQLKDREADLQRKLRSLPGVIGVEVSIVEPEDSSIKVDPYPSTASVQIVTRDDPPSFDQATIKGLVARSVPKLNPDSVFVAITPKPVRPLPWREIGALRRHKILDALGLGVMLILGSSIAVLFLQVRRQSHELSSLREMQRQGLSRVDEEALNQDLELAEANSRGENGANETRSLGRAGNTTDVAPTTS